MDERGRVVDELLPTASCGSGVFVSGCRQAIIFSNKYKSSLVVLPFLSCVGSVISKCFSLLLLRWALRGYVSYVDCSDNDWT